MGIESRILYKYNDQICKKERNDHCRVMVEKKQHWDLKNQIQDLIILHINELSIVSIDTG